MADRLSYNNDGKTIDEVVLSNANVHLEQLDDTTFMLIVENNKHRWHLRIGSKSGRAKVDAWVYEENQRRIAMKGKVTSEQLFGKHSL